jgi:hypothetical protein
MNRFWNCVAHRTSPTAAWIVAGVMTLASAIAAGDPSTGAVPVSPPASQPAPAARNDAAAGADAYDWKQWAEFWAFRPVVKPAVPDVSKVPPAGGASRAAPGWGRNPIDAFVLAKLRAAGLSPAAEANKLTLVRRATFDLTGLPPTPEEIRAFLADASDDAYERLVDRLLASPHYGERWGRHWLDVARYVPGRVSFVGVKNTAGDSHYRDYVVRAFNADKPYDRFVTEQLAGDLLPVPDGVAKGDADGDAGTSGGAGSVTAADRQAYLDQLVAPAFLSIGSWFDMDTDPNRLRLEMVDEMVNTTTKAFLGLSVACARCHDHKFDPIPIADYYALGGIFRSTRLLGELNEFWRDGRVRQLRPLAMPAEVAANYATRKRAADVKQQRWDALVAKHAERTAAWGRDEASYRAAADRVRAGAPAGASAGAAVPVVLAFEAEDFDGQNNLRIAQLRKGDKATDVLETLNPTAQFVVYRVVVSDTGTYRLTALHSTDDRTPITVTFNGDTVATAALAEPTGGFDPLYQRWDVAGTGTLRSGVNFVRLSAKGGMFPRLDRFRVAKADAALDARVTSVAAERGLDARLLARFVESPSEPWPTVADVEALLPDAERAELARLSAEADRLAARARPFPLAVAVTDEPAPVDLPVHLRGQTYRTSAALVPRGVPRFLDHALPRPEIPAGASGRLELAKWLTDPRHPLTARVMVNRVWGWHFGRGLVDSPSDFGSRGSAPTHPELLDWLAATFVEQGWSVKQLHRLILTSSTYRQGGASSGGGAGAGAEKGTGAGAVADANAGADQSEPRGSALGSEGATNATGLEPSGPVAKAIGDIRASGGSKPVVPVRTDTTVRKGTTSDVDPDPDDRLLSHFPRRRLEAEALYDAMLSTTNALPRQPAGAAVDLAKSGNRAMYTLTTGRSPKGLGPDVRKMLALFDCDLTGQPVGQRPASATPAQSLFWLNSPLVTTFADAFAARLLKMDKLTDAKRLEMAYLLAVGRPPSPAMAERSLAFLAQCEDDGEEPQAAWAKLCQALYASTEFRYVE